jgi:hypothetical protein
MHRAKEERRTKKSGEERHPPATQQDTSSAPPAKKTTSCTDEETLVSPVARRPESQINPHGHLRNLHFAPICSTLSDRKKLRLLGDGPKNTVIYAGKFSCIYNACLLKYDTCLKSHLSFKGFLYKYYPTM